MVLMLLSKPSQRCELAIHEVSKLKSFTLNLGVVIMWVAMCCRTKASANAAAGGSSD
jgi:hypothetical protein